MRGPGDVDAAPRQYSRCHGSALRGPVYRAAVRYLVLSDVHANAVALDAVLRSAAKRGFDATLFLGDAVGYYPAATEAVERLADLAPEVALMGNHDALLLALARGEDPAHGRENTVVRPAIEAQLETLSDAALDWLRGLRAHHVDETFECVHGALARPWQYLNGLADIEDNMGLLQRPLCLVGHTHVPRVLAGVQGPNERPMWRQVDFRDEGGTYRMPPLARGFFNPGAVGQPRDGVPLAAYGLFEPDKRKLEVVRVPFDVAVVQRQVRAAGLPDTLAARLAVGR